MSTADAASEFEASNESPTSYALLRLPTVLRITGLKKTTLYGLIKVEDFPRPVRLTKHLVAWRSADVRRWTQERTQTQGR